MNVSARWFLGTLAVGGLVWAFGLFNRPDSQPFFAQVEWLFLFGVGLMAPLSLRLALHVNPQRRIYRAATFFHPAAILAAGVAVYLEPGMGAAAGASLWLAQTLLLVACGLTRFWMRRALAIEELCIDLGLIYVPISGVWLLAYSAHYPLLTFDSTFVLLTAVHFTFISLGALVMAGMIGRQLRRARVWQAYRMIAWLIIISPPLVAAGITVSQFSGRLWLEAGSVVVLAGSFLLLALLCLFDGLPQPVVPRILIFASSASLLATMGLALAYSLGRLTGGWAVSLGDMAQWHGWLNAVGFTFCGLLAWNLKKFEPQRTRRGTEKRSKA